jgi:hypothetical protein
VLHLSQIDGYFLVITRDHFEHLHNGMGACKTLPYQIRVPWFKKTKPDDSFFLSKVEFQQLIFLSDRKDFLDDPAGIWELLVLNVL